MKAEFRQTRPEAITAKQKKIVTGEREERSDEAGKKMLYDNKRN